MDVERLDARSIELEVGESAELVPRILPKRKRALPSKGRAQGPPSKSHAPGAFSARCYEAGVYDAFYIEKRKKNCFPNFFL